MRPIPSLRQANSLKTFVVSLQMHRCKLVFYLQEKSKQLGVDATLAAVTLQTVEDFDPSCITDENAAVLRSLGDFIGSDGSKEFREALCTQVGVCIVCQVVIDRLKELSGTENGVGS